MGRRFCFRLPDRRWYNAPNGARGLEGLGAPLLAERTILMHAASAPILVLWIEGTRRKTPPWAERVARRGFKLARARSGREGLALLSQVYPEVAVINAIAFNSSGRRLSRMLRDQAPQLPQLLLTEKVLPLEALVADVVLTPPFTARKIVNRLRRLLVLAEGRHCLEVGPLRLDLDNRRLYCHGREFDLTPRLTRLLRVLMENAGYVVPRDVLFRKVWQTDYLGDTRTLDVHISWLRRILEEDPRRPQLLRTVRGRGYLLNVYDGNDQPPRVRPCDGTDFDTIPIVE